jgi:phage tail-like protein
MDEEGRFCLPASLALACGRALPDVGRVLNPSAAAKQPPSAADGLRTRPTFTARGDWLLYVVDRGTRRVDAFTDGGRHLRHSWGACMDWQPCDVAACGDAAFILDEENQVVYRHSAGRDTLKILVRDAARHWSRIACDDGSLYLYTPGEPCAQQFDCNGRPRGDRSYGAVAALFEAARPDAPAPLENGLFFDRLGEPVSAVDFSEPSGKRLYQSDGTWQSKPLDSDVYRCQWHRIELELAAFPPGSKISVSTCAHEKREDVDDPTKSQFVDAQTIVAAIDEEQNRFDFLVQSVGGQYLTIRIALQGDGFSTPAVDSAKVHYPRESYLEYLPATYAADDESRVFLERFLSIFQTEWDDLDRSIDEVERFFDPDAVPEGPFMQYLAEQWLALPLEGAWGAAQKRRLLSAVPKIYPHRGQLEGLRDFISVYLANMSGLETEDVRALGFPVIVEGFRERRHLFATSGEASRLGDAAPLWSASVKRRLQLGVFAREGEVDLVSTGDPEHDLFAQYAHRFSLAVPAAWVRTADGERMIRRAIEAEKPAQTQYDLCLVEPRFRLDAQSTIGIDTIIGAAPALRLGCDACTDAAPSLPPAGRLGYDSVLASDAAGKDSVLA